MRNLGKIDWTDVARHGAHTAQYADGEIVEFLIFKENAQPAPNVLIQHNRVMGDGNTIWLQQMRAIYWPSPGFGNSYHSLFVTREWLPRNFVVDFWGRYHVFDAGQHFFFALAKDMPNLNDYVNFGSVPPYPAFIKLGLWHSQTQQYFKKRNIAGILSDDSQISTTPASNRGVFIRKGDYIYLFCYDEKGNFQSAYGGFRDSLLYDAGQPDRLALQGIAENTTGGRRNSHNDWFQIGISEYQEIDWMPESSVSVTTTGSVVGAGSAKEALTTEDESSYVNLNQNQEIIINLTSALTDTDVWCVEVTADSTDANPLLASFNRADIQAVYTTAIQLGNTRAKRDVGVRQQEAWTNTIKHIFYHELEYLFRNNFSTQAGCKKIKIRNENASAVKVFFVRVLRDGLSGAIKDTANRINYGMRIEPENAPLGTAGPTQILKFQNTAGSTMLAVKLFLQDDGSPALDGLIQYAAAPGGPWYDTANPPPDPDGVLLASGLVDGAEALFYIRTNLPAADPQLASFISRFRFTATT